MNAKEHAREDKNALDARRTEVKAAVLALPKAHDCIRDTLRASYLNHKHTASQTSRTRHTSRNQCIVRSSRSQQQQSRRQADNAHFQAATP